MVAVNNRVTGEVPLPTAAGVAAIRSALRRLWPFKALSPLTLEQALESFKGRKFEVYSRAFESLQHKPLSKRDARISAFVKAEKFNPLDKINPDPRLIQARDPRYNLHVSRYMRPLEHEVYALRKNRLPVIVKCLNPVQRAEVLMKKWALFKRPVCFSIDCSRWDKHVSLEVLELEHEFYQSWFKGDIELEQLMRWQRINKCRTANGVKYTVVGGRMSGDMNTALGNCVLMCGMVTAVLDDIAGHYEIMDDGDDCLVFCEEDDFGCLTEHLPKRFLEYGQELKIENVARHPQDIVFCQGKLTLGEEWTMARNWRKVLSQSCCGTKHWNDPLMVPAMFGLLGDCENALHRGIPILQVFAERLRELSGGARARLCHLDSSYVYRIGAYDLGDIRQMSAAPITELARFQFFRTWGVEIWEQLAIEHHIRNWSPSITYLEGPAELDHRWDHVLSPSIPNPIIH